MLTADWVRFTASRGAGETTVLGDGDEGAEQFRIDAGLVAHSSISKMHCTKNDSLD